MNPVNVPHLRVSCFRSINHPELNDLCSVGITRFLDQKSLRCLSCTSKEWRDFFLAQSSFETRVHEISNLVTLVIDKIPLANSLSPCRTKFLNEATPINFQHEKEKVLQEIQSVLREQGTPSILHDLEESFFPILGRESTLDLVFRLKIQKTIGEAELEAEPQKSETLQSLVEQMAYLGLFSDVDKVIDSIQDVLVDQPFRTDTIWSVVGYYLVKLEALCDKDETEEKVNHLIGVIRRLKTKCLTNDLTEEVSNYIERSIIEIQNPATSWCFRPSPNRKTGKIKAAEISWIYPNNAAIYSI